MTQQERYLMIKVWDYWRTHSYIQNLRNFINNLNVNASKFYSDTCQPDIVQPDICLLLSNLVTFQLQHSPTYDICHLRHLTTIIINSQENKITSE